MSKNKTVRLQGVTLECLLVTHPRAKRVRIAVLQTGIVRITKPSRVSASRALLFAEENASWIMERHKEIENNIITPEESATRFLKHKESARKILTDKVRHWNEFYNFKYGDIRIKKPKTVWGSCSSKGNLNFNYRLIFLPEDLIDYVVVHELCHLQEMNHSRAFWDLVGQVLPDYRERRAQLKRHR